MKLRHFVTAVAISLAAPWSLALDAQPYTAAALGAAQQAGKPVALHFHADWCPTCLAQEKVINGFKPDAALAITVLKVNYDNEKALRTQYKVRSQATLVVLRGDKETARIAGDTDPERLKAALKSAL